ncbi:MAG TPA: class I SAM-dependent methyltransferase, partial [Candidatus Eremiobacteraceae bacterium]
GFDISETYIDYARERTNDSRATFAVADGQAFTCADATYDVAVAGLCLSAMPDQPRAVAEMMRVVKPGGIVGAYVWDFGGKMQMLTHFWETVEALDPGSQDSDIDPQFAICKPEPLAELFRSAGLHDVEVRAIDAPTVFKDFDDYWNPFLTGKAPAQQHTASLSTERRELLRDRLRSTLPVSRNGSILLIARAWAVKARVPHA